MFEVRNGIGIDTHAFDVDRGVGNHSIMLGGVAIPSQYAIKAHSDGDVLLHSITDAMLGAISYGNIGVHFPSSDKRLVGVSSKVFVDFAFDALSEKGWKVVNIDSTIICEKPRLMPYSHAMVKSIAAMLGLGDLSRVSVKATTNEGLGYIGRCEAISVYTICTIQSAA